MGRSKRVLVIAMLVVATPFIFLYISRELFIARIDRFQSVTLGMTEQAAIEAMRESPGLIVPAGTCRCLYFEGKGFTAQELSWDGVPVDSLEKIPWAYAAFLFVFDKENKLIASDYLGESLGVNSIEGTIRYPGSPGNGLGILNKHCDLAPPAP
jgi:hypothetical protein